MKKSITVLLLTLSLSAIATDWLVLTPKQKKTLSQDKCAAAAVQASLSLVSNEIQDAGVDYPDNIYLHDLHISVPKQIYAVTFKDDSTILVETKSSGSTCKAKKASRIVLQ